MQRYLDYNATCPTLQQAIDAACDVATSAAGNPSSMHWAGRQARRALDDARDKLAAYLNIESSSLVFTSGGTEANNMAIFGCLSHSKPGKVVVSAIEHPSVLQTAEYWCEKLGHQLCLVSPDANGVILAEDFCAVLDEDTVMACLMWANNEIGVIQPVETIVATCREYQIPVLIDGVQAMGKLPMDLTRLGADFVSLSAHKIGGMKGVGALAIRRTALLETWALGGGQERGRRSGTENVPGVVAFAAVLGVLNYQDAEVVRDAFEYYLLEKMPDVRIYGQGVKRVGNTSMFTVPDMDGETLLMQLDLAGFAVASGSACSSGKREPSHVLRAMGVPEREARSSLRVSFGLEHDDGDAKALVDELVRIRALLKKMSGR